MNVFNLESIACNIARHIKILLYEASMKTSISYTEAFKIIVLNKNSTSYCDPLNMTKI